VARDFGATEIVQLFSKTESVAQIGFCRVTISEGEGARAELMQYPRTLGDVALCFRR
jgi:hypothetical protein